MLINELNLFPIILLLVVFVVIIMDMLPKNILGRFIIYLFFYIYLGLVGFDNIYVLFVALADVFIKNLKKIAE